MKQNINLVVAYVTDLAKKNTKKGKLTICMEKAQSEYSGSPCHMKKVQEYTHKCNK